MINKWQRVKSYVSGARLAVYETEQYHKASNGWYIVGDSSTSEELINIRVSMHNLKLAKAKK